MFLCTVCMYVCCCMTAASVHSSLFKLFYVTKRELIQKMIVCCKLTTFSALTLDYDCSHTFVQWLTLITLNSVCSRFSEVAYEGGGMSKAAINILCPTSELGLDKLCFFSP